MQKFSDVSFQNSIMDIDVQKNKVSFDYTKPKTFWNEIPYIFITIGVVYCILIALVGAMIGGISIITVLISNPEQIIQSELTTITIYDIMISTIEVITGVFWGVLIFSPIVIISILVYIFREHTTKYYPKLNAWLFSFVGITHKVKVTDLKTKKYVLRYFKNIKLEYELTGEYAEKLKNIKVLPISYKNEQYPLGWFAEFIFTSVPKNGEMNLEFM